MSQYAALVTDIQTRLAQTQRSKFFRLLSAGIKGMLYQTQWWQLCFKRIVFLICVSVCLRQGAGICHSTWRPEENFVEWVSGTRLGSQDFTFTCWVMPLALTANLTVYFFIWTPHFIITNNRKPKTFKSKNGQMLLTFFDRTPAPALRFRSRTMLHSITINSSSCLGWHKLLKGWLQNVFPSISATKNKHKNKMTDKCLSHQTC